MVKLEREQIETLNRRLNNVYDGYRGIVDFFNKVARSGRIIHNTYTLELSEKQSKEMSDSMVNELSKIENAVQDMKNLLDGLTSKTRESTS
ncbi:MAG: hypothetical protein OEZ48_10670 [Candidatus Bathyarchaeota archaeon]|nr:hypothetical protein [Candidatus Bathyarchaeota archaeon]MDH5688307.1 hypothetical protein [Candidatus Bathyarchaeota archaeon]